MSWFLRYAGCEAETACMGPHAGWWLFGVQLWAYPYMILVALIFSLPFFLSGRSVEGMLGRRKEYRKPLKDNLWKVILVFVIVMVIEIALWNFYRSGIVY